MASPQVAAVLSQAETHDDKASALQSVIANISSLTTPATAEQDLEALTDSIFAASLGVVATRALLVDLTKALNDFHNDDLWISVGARALACIAANATLNSSLGDQAAALREAMATAYENQEDFERAAATLATIDLESPQRRVDDHDKARLWVRIMRNYLEVGDSTAAETYLNRLRNIIHRITDQELILHYKLSTARIYDSNRRFLPAAQTYHEISYSTVVAEEERLHTLGMAIKCAVLAPAGPPRSRVLNRMYKDERSWQLPEFGMLEKMYLDRLLEPAEADKFAQDLETHQKAITADGSTVFTKAVVEHNLLSASRLYRNIGFDALGVLLGLDATQAEDTTARMMEQGRLKGWIDQIDRIIYFEPGEPTEKAGHVERAAFQETRRWDANVQSLSESVEALTEALQGEFPEFVATQIAQEGRVAA